MEMTLIRLTKSLQAWRSAGFEEIFKKEVELLDIDLLPLQRGLATTSQVTDAPRKVIVLHSSEKDGFIHVKAGIFYSGIIAGCSCADDPTPVQEQNEYCEMQFAVHKQTAETEVLLLDG